MTVLVPKTVVTPRLTGSGIIGLAALALICPVDGHEGCRLGAGGVLAAGHADAPNPLQTRRFPRVAQDQGSLHFGSSVTIMLGSGQTRTVQRQAIQALRVFRPARQRYGWIPGAAVFVRAIAYMLNSPGTRDLDSGRVGVPAVISAPAWIGGYLLTPSTRLVYRAQQVPGRDGSSKSDFLVTGVAMRLHFSLRAVSEVRPLPHGGNEHVQPATRGRRAARDTWRRPLDNRSGHSGKVTKPSTRKSISAW